MIGDILLREGTKWEQFSQKTARTLLLARWRSWSAQIRAKDEMRRGL
jgi:hypothetical protein